MAVQSPLGDINIVSPINTFVLNTLTLKESAFYCLLLLLFFYIFTKNEVIIILPAPLHFAKVCFFHSQHVIGCAKTFLYWYTVLYCP